MSYAHVKRLHSVKWRIFMLVRGYSDDAKAIIENVYKVCMEENKTMQKLLLKTCTKSAWKKISLLLNCVWDRTAALTDV